jgi:hypothetical protein
MWFKKFREAWRQDKEDAASGEPRAKWSVGWDREYPQTNLTNEDFRRAAELLRETFPDKDETPGP